MAHVEVEGEDHLIPKPIGVLWVGSIGWRRGGGIESIAESHSINVPRPDDCCNDAGTTLVQADPQPSISQFGALLVVSNHPAPHAQGLEMASSSSGTLAIA